MRMRFRFPPVLSLALALTTSHARPNGCLFAEEPAARAAGIPELNEATYASVRDAVLPSVAEQAWRDVGWRASFGEAVGEARRSGKPVFLWAMNGHPLACT